MARLARERGLIDPNTADAIASLALLRNMAAHGRISDDLDPRRAVEYATLADAVLQNLTRPSSRSGA